MFYLKCDEFDPVFVFTERAHMILMNSLLKQKHVNFISIRRFVMYLDDFIYFVEKKDKSGIGTEILSNQHARGVDFGRR